MKTVQSMLEAHPEHAAAAKLDPIVVGLEALSLCEQVCLSCADACLGEEHLEELRSCIRLNWDCAVICATTAKLIVRQTETSGPLVHAQLHACVLACQLCADLCATHARHHRHCGICAAACRDCQEKCNVLLGELSGAGVVGSN